MVDESDASKPFRSVTDALGQLVRRVSTVVSEVSESVTLPEGLRKDLEEARAWRIAGDYGRAGERLQTVLDAHPEQTHVMTSSALLAVHEFLFTGRRVESPLLLGALTRARVTGSTSPAAPAGVILLAAAYALDQSGTGTSPPIHDSPQDALRRAARARERLASFELTEYELLERLLAARAHQTAGHFERAIRELHKARKRLPTLAGPRLREWMLDLGAELMLADGLPADAERWVRGFHRLRIAQSTRETEAASGPGDPKGDREEPTPSVVELDSRERTWMARIFATFGDRGGATAWLEGVPDEPEWVHARLRVDLALGDGDLARERALELLRARADDPVRLRLWALAQLLPRARPSTREGGRAILDALLAALDAAPPARRDAHLHELAHAVLDTGELGGEAARRLLRAIETASDPPSVESRLVRCRARVASGAPLSTIDDDFLAGPPRRFRGDSSVSLAAPGPDELSPLRDAHRREKMLRAHTHLAEAERALVGTPALHERDNAEAALVAALMEDPQLEVAKTRMAELAQPEATPTLEALLAAATRLLARVPAQILGVSLTGVAEALAQVVAARERLARPLTIAIMGEFSSGKSTFVNALLGQSVAPMGVLPTTSTINVFRRGSRRGARVHYRDGRIETVADQELEPWLAELDPADANQIRYLEIDRVEGRMGDASVVDTPGLNALDTYHERVAREFLDEADAVVWIFSATQGGTASEASMLDELRVGGRQVLGILNKVDTLDEAEKKELGDYLRAKLGGVLVDVIPLSATRALAYRTAAAGARADPSDPFAEVDRALESHFLQRARQLKTELTRRRLAEALSLARETTIAAAKSLESRADTVDLSRALASELTALQGFASDLAAALLDIDDPLTRECLALGIVVSGSGRSRDREREDFEYLEGRLESLCLRALQGATQNLSGEHDAILACVEHHLLPWARGYMRARVATNFGERLVDRHGDAAREGEAALRRALRRGLEPIATDWSAEARSLARSLERELVRARRSITHEPRAQAQRLHTALLAGIEQLLARAEPGEDTRARPLEHAHAGHPRRGQGRSA